MARGPVFSPEHSAWCTPSPPLLQRYDDYCLVGSGYNTVFIFVPFSVKLSNSIYWYSTMLFCKMEVPTISLASRCHGSDCRISYLCAIPSVSFRCLSRERWSRHGKNQCLFSISSSGTLCIVISFNLWNKWEIEAEGGWVIHLKSHRGRKRRPEIPLISFPPPCSPSFPGL